MFQLLIEANSVKEKKHEKLVKQKKMLPIERSNLGIREMQR